MPKLKNILVVGAGIAGPAVCYWLKKYGFSPTLIELHSGLRSGGYAIDIRGIAVDVVKEMGIYDKIYTQRTQIHSTRYIDADGHTVLEEKGEHSGFRQGEDVEIVRGDLGAILMSSIDDVPCYFSHSVREITHHKDSVDVIFNNGKSASFDLIIGADGLHSSIRRKVFNPDEFELLNLGSYISVFSIPNFLNLNHSEVLFETNQKLVHVYNETDSNMARAGFLFRSNKVLKDIRDEQQQKAFLRDTYNNLGWESDKLLDFIGSSEDFYFDSITQVKMNAWTKDRVALLGDCGYCASPLSGQGTSLALVGAYILAGELKEAGADYKLAFDQYNQQLKPYVEANQSLGAWVSETFLISSCVSKEAAEQRNQAVLDIMKTAANAITLPSY
jgi:2-polyprenyl-6-methoxyphenol hydroxylase-like FAD-dependent oxidoreductase